MSYKVSATLHGKRIKTSKSFRNYNIAQAYADATNRFRKGARAKVITC